ncbi:nucleotidyltransferase family protein [Clostridium sp. Cult3]|uniref:nucleotidyltransferase family protein n=1 Tax=Clostridium sp. Cult3 TaxID=2079004 RepID=UPI001F36517B|nr:nucleotidyltransferase family protein [Clostridium sp. Cult3]MCF6459685.1 molybdenum cofactor cytidylyltransferase [Clostridium sp. Cult3]
MITGIILASGFSKRMNRDKLLMEIDGVPMVERVIERAVESRLDEVILVYRVDEVKRIGKKYGIKTLYNPRAHLGQSEGLKLGVEEAKTSQAYMFLMGDMPFITTELIDKLIQEYICSKAQILVPYYNGKRGMPTVFSHRLRKELLNIEGDKGGRSIIKNNPSLIRKVHIDDERLGLDIDTQEEYKRWDSGAGSPCPR